MKYLIITLVIIGSMGIIYFIFWLIDEISLRGMMKETNKIVDEILDDMKQGKRK